jgi:hypothetical protein
MSRSVEQIAKDIRSTAASLKALEADNHNAQVAANRMHGWAEALEALHQEKLPCPTCRGTGALSPDDSERVIRSNGELFNAGYDAAGSHSKGDRS